MAYAIYIAAAASIGLLIGFVALSITWLEKAVLHNIRSRTVGLISVYDELLEEKSRQLTEVALQQEIIMAQTRQPQEEQPVVNTPAQPPARSFVNLMEQAGKAAYRDDNFSNIYRTIRKNFNFNIDEIATRLADKTNINKGPATKLLEELEWDTVYRLSTLQSRHRLQILDRALDDAGKMLVKNHTETYGSFNVLEFYEALKGIADTEPKPVTLRISSDFTGDLKNYEGVEIVPDDEICEGFQVEENHLLYDYCIKARELR